MESIKGCFSRASLTLGIEGSSIVIPSCLGGKEDYSPIQEQSHLAFCLGQWRGDSFNRSSMPFNGKRPWVRIHWSLCSNGPLASQTSTIDHQPLGGGGGSNNEACLAIMLSLARYEGLLLFGCTQKLHYLKCSTSGRLLAFLDDRCSLFPLKPGVSLTKALTQSVYLGLFTPFDKSSHNSSKPCSLGRSRYTCPTLSIDLWADKHHTKKSWTPHSKWEWCWCPSIVEQWRPSWALSK